MCVLAPILGRPTQALHFPLRGQQQRQEKGIGTGRGHWSASAPLPGLPKTTNDDLEGCEKRCQFNQAANQLEHVLTKLVVPSQRNCPVTTSLQQYVLPTQNMDEDRPVNVTIAIKHQDL